VFAGRDCRKRAGLELFGNGIASRLMLSVGRYEIRRFERLQLPTPVALLQTASEVLPTLRHYFVCFEGKEATVERIALCRFGTWSETAALGQWLQERPFIRSATIVSSGFHLRRIKLCSRGLLPEYLNVSYLAVPDEDAGLDRHRWWRSALGMTLLSKEYLKMSLYWLMTRR
jgi:hypothetical protein